MQPSASDSHEVEAKLIPLADALKPYSRVSIRTGRNEIAKGHLPAAKIGRAYYVDPADVARLFAPTLRQPAQREGRESPTARAARQLAEAGVSR